MLMSAFFLALQELSIENPSPLVPSASDLASLASLEVLKLGNMDLPVEGVHALLTSASSRLRHLTFPHIKIKGDSKCLSLSWSSCTLESLATCPTEHATAADIFLPVLAHLPHLKSVGVWGTLDVYMYHGERMFRWLKHLAPFECLGGKLHLFPRIDDPADDSPELLPDAVLGMERMDKQELAHRLR